MYPIKKEIAGNELHGWMSDFTTPPPEPNGGEQTLTIRNDYS